MQETTIFVESFSNAASATITILPPECGDQDIPSDKEDFEYGQEDQLLEPAGEMEVVAVSICDDDEEEFHQTGNRRESPRWKKQETSAKTVLTLYGPNYFFKLKIFFCEFCVCSLTRITITI